MTKKTIQRADIEPTLVGLPDADRVLHLLWKKSRNHLADGDLAGIAAAGGRVSETLEQLADMLAAIGCVDSAANLSPDAKTGSISDTSTILFPLSDWLRTQAALLHLSDDATGMLLQPSVYRKGQP